MKLSIRITTLSPIHIGTGATLNRFSYVLHNGWLYLCKDEMVIQELERRNQLAQYARLLPAGHNLKDVLRELKVINDEFLKACSYRRVQVSFNPKNELRLCLTDPLSGLPYIPGSSVKGALRTGVLSRMWKGPELDDIVRRCPENIRKCRGNAIEGKLASAKIPATNNPQRDLMRLVKISDLHPKEPLVSELVAVGLVHVRPEGYSFDDSLLIYVDTIPPDSVFEGSVNWDGFLAKMYLPGGNPESLFRIMMKRTAEHLEQQHQRFQDAGLSRLGEYYGDLEGRGANIRLGWGTGWESITLGSMLSPTSREKIGRLIRQRMRRRRHKETPVHGRNFPSTYKVFSDGDGPSGTLGWAKIELLEG